MVALESMGVPAPGETTLVTAALYAGTTGRLDIAGVVVAAAVGAIVGDNAGYWIGRELGYRWLVRHGRLIRVTSRRLKLGQYLFRRHGGKVVFFGRFVAVLRALAAFLAGASCMGWRRFLVFNAAGGIVWAVVYGLGAYELGQRAASLVRPVGRVLVAGAAAAAVVGVLFVRKHEQRLEDEAERELGS